MLDSIVIQIGLVVVAVMSVAALVVSMFVLIRHQQLAQAVDERLKTIRLDVNSMSSGSVGVGKRLQEVEKKLAHKREAAVPVVEQGYEPYSQATRLLDSGANIEDVVRSCGITRAEAELMGLMHKQMKRRGSHPW